MIGHVGADAVTSATVLGTETKLTWAEFHWNNMLICCHQLDSQGYFLQVSGICSMAEMTSSCDVSKHDYRL